MSLSSRISFPAGGAVKASGETRAHHVRRLAIAARRAESEDEREARQAAHHPSWKHERARFADRLAALGIAADIDTVSAWCESLDPPRPRPSAVDNRQREKILVALERPCVQAKYEAWASAPVDGSVRCMAAPSRCSSRGAEVVWVETSDGRRIPCEPEVFREAHGEDGRAVLVEDDGTARVLRLDPLESERGQNESAA